MDRDLKAVDDLGSPQRPLAQLLAGLEDSMLAAGSEAYSAALGYYQAVRRWLPILCGYRAGAGVHAESRKG